MRKPVILLASILGSIYLFGPSMTHRSPQTEIVATTDAARANEMIRRQPGFFVPNLGQWDHAARFMHRNGPMTLRLEDRGWVLDLGERTVEPETKPHESGVDKGEVDQQARGVALRMTFEGDGHVPEISGEKKLDGHHNYFLGNDESRWRTGVPLYSSVCYENLYPGIDLRLREMNGVPEYDLLLQPGADLSLVSVHVEGAEGLSIARDGSLVIATALGPLTQSVPKTWQVGADRRKREVACHFTLLGADRFGFAAPGWDGDTSLTIDPGLIWSTYLGGSLGDPISALSVDASGVVTVAGTTHSSNFPTTAGAFDRTFNSVPSGPFGQIGSDVFVSRLDPRKTGRAQLIHSTFLGGRARDYAQALAVAANGVVTVTGATQSTNFPTTNGAYDRTYNGGGDVFVSCLDPGKTGAAQFVYSTFVGGSSNDEAYALSNGPGGVVTVTGNTDSIDFPTTNGAYDTTPNGYGDTFVCRLIPIPVGRLGLVYGTYLGGSRWERPRALWVGVGGVVTVAGLTQSTNFPTTNGAYDSTHNGGPLTNYYDAFISRLDPSKRGNAQLIYGTFLGGGGFDRVTTISVDARGIVTAAGQTQSRNFPTTRGAYDTTYNGGPSDAFVSRLDPRKAGSAQLVYGTFLGGANSDIASALSVDASGVVTLAGQTLSTNFPTTSGAYDTTLHGNYDAFVSRLDLQKTGAAQLVYGTLLGGSGLPIAGTDSASALSVDASGVVTIAGFTSSPNFATTSGAYDTTYNGGPIDAFVSRLDMGVALYGDVHEVLIKAGGTQTLTVHAGKAHANRLYWIFGSITGTKPGVNLLGVHIPLNADLYTNVAMAVVNTTVFTRFKGTLNARGLATAAFNVPANLPAASGFTFHHAYVVYDASGKLYLASNAVPLILR